MPHFVPAVLLVAALSTSSTKEPNCGAVIPVKLPSRDNSPLFRDGLPHGGEPTPPPRRKMLGLGVGFQMRAGAQGIQLDQVVSGSPAERAGLTAGTVIVEINGESTLGRSADDCTRLVREAGNSVPIKYIDPATLKLRTRTLEKEWFFIPSNSK